MDINHSVYIHAFECHRRQGPWFVERHHHNIHELYGCVQGSVVQSVNGKEIRMQAGDWLLFFPGCRHSLEKPADITHQYFVFHFHLDDLSLPAAGSNQGYLLIRPVPETESRAENEENPGRAFGRLDAEIGDPTSLPWLQTQIMRLVDQYGLLNIGEKDPVPTLPAKARLQLEALFLLSIAAVCAQTNSTGTEPANDLSPSPMASAVPTAYGSTLANEIARLIEWQLPGKLDMGGISRILGISNSACTRCFTRHFGQAPSAYRKSLILSRARELLLQTDQTVASIAEALGFSSLELFSRQFRRWTGVSPSTYRRQPLKKAKTGSQTEARDGKPGSNT